MNITNNRLFYCGLIFIMLMFSFCSESGENKCKNENDPIPGEALSDLGSPPGTYIAESEKNDIKIPFEFFGMNPLIRGKINGKDVKLLIDNGSLWDDIWFYDGEVDSLNLHYINDEVGKVTGDGEDGGSDIKEGNLVNIAFNEIEFIDQPTLISVKEAGWGKFFSGINGQVSSLLFKHFVVKFDFDKNIITLTKPEKFKYTGKSKAIPMTKTGNDSYSIPLKLKLADTDDISVNIDLDIGTISPLYITENKALNITIPENSEKKFYGYGASGAIYSYLGAIEKVTIGEHSLFNVPANFAEESSNPDSHDERIGLLGLPFMMQFNVTFDYFNKVIYFEPNKSFGKPFKKAD